MKKILLILTLSCSSLCEIAYPNPAFKPWGSNVRVGDENVVLLKKNITRASDKKGNRSDTIRQDKIHSVYNGVQGGAYFLIRFFQVVISPQDGPNCRFTPTCSAYGREAVEKHGALLGSFMAGERLLRCNPYGHPGVDRVPDSLFGH